jgi:alpha-tubulin suppressor-like RCC1 family protein
MYFSCGLQANGKATCWGDNEFDQQNFPTETFTQIAPGGEATCGLRANGTVACWGWQLSVGDIISPAGIFTQLSLCDNLACGLRTDGSVTCWGIPLTLDP